MNYCELYGVLHNYLLAGLPGLRTLSKVSENFTLLQISSREENLLYNEWKALFHCHQRIKVRDGHEFKNETGSSLKITILSIWVGFELSKLENLD